MRALITVLWFFLLLFFPSLAIASTIVINELMVNPAGSDTNEWIELHSTDPNFSSPDYWIDDDNTLTVNNAVQTGSDDPGSDPVHLSLDFHGSNFFVVPLSSYLNNTGDHPTLFLYQNGTATVVDEYQYSSDPGDDVTLGRFPDGGSKAATLALATKGSSNSPPPSSTPVPPPTSTTAPKPTSTPKPKTPTKEPTETTDPNHQETTISTKSPIPSVSKNSSVLGVTVQSSEEGPTQRLEIDKTISPTESSSVSDASESGAARPVVPIILIIVGGVLAAGAGIPLLVYKLRARSLKAKPV